MSHEKNKIEKRRYPRIKKNIPIKLQHEEFDIVTETKDISCIGAYCQVDRYVSPFTKIRAKILLPSKIKNNTKYIACAGVVVRTEKNDSPLKSQYNIAIYFSEISKVDLSKIDRFVKNHPKL